MKKTFLSLLIATTLMFGCFSVVSQPDQPFDINFEATQSVMAEEVILQSIEITGESAGTISVPKVEQAQQLPSIPDGDPLATLGKIVTDWKTASPIALGILFVMFVAQLSKAGWVESVFALFGWKNALEWKRAIISLTAAVYGLLYFVQGGSAWVAAILAVIAGGGAVAGFEGLKGIYYLLTGKKKVEKATLRV